MTTIICWTLFNITQTGVLNRNAPPVDVDIAAWTQQRNTQCNYDTLLQVISLRSQPEETTIPQRVSLTKELLQHFGSDYKRSKNNYCWTFQFNVTHGSVFNNGIHELGALFSDSNGVPMILIGDEVKNLTPVLASDGELKNIHYTILSHDNT